MLQIQDGNDVVVVIPEDSFSVRLQNGKCGERDFRNLSGTFAREFKKIIERMIE